MRFELTGDPEAFAARAEAFLAARVERNVLATVLVAARSGRGGLGPGPLFALGLDDHETVRAAAMRTPPWPLLATRVEASAAATALTAAWLERDPELPGVVAEAPTARAIAASFTRLTRRATACRMREAMHLLRDVHDPTRPAPGHLRPAAGSERDLLIDWERAFVREAGVTGEDQAARTVDARLARGAQLVWDDGGGPVATLGLSPMVAGIVRIGPVYTPPERRRRGYATSAVAAASRRALAGGADRCALFTDLANPTSNRIYASIGYRPFGAWEEHAFDPPAPRA